FVLLTEKEAVFGVTFPGFVLGRVRFERLPPVEPRLLPPSQPHQEAAYLSLVLPLSRVERDGLSERGECLVVQAFVLQIKAEVRVEFARVGVEADGSPSLLNGLRLPACRGQGLGEPFVAGDGSRGEVHGPTELLDGLLQPASLRQCRTELEVAEVYPRANRHRRLTVADRVLLVQQITAE